ncbi:MAG TPA: hypothetical protein VMO47_16145, partial [Rhodothermales bacterium]|nr:hypothetical protein [Rhodothermales bacterium]
MTPERWKHVQVLFHEALDQPPERRTVFLDRACDGDGELRRDVEALLAADDNPAPLFDAPPDALAAEPFEDTPVAGRSLGAYRLLE